MERTAIAIKEQDNVATAIKDIPAGQEAVVGVGEQTLIIPVTQDIAYGHKFALRVSNPASTPMCITWRVCAAEATWTWTEPGPQPLDMRCKREFFRLS
jgi:hypothetical protein